MTYGGGVSPSYGTIFKINIDRGGYTILHDFDGGEPTEPIPTAS